MAMSDRRCETCKTWEKYTPNQTSVVDGSQLCDELTKIMFPEGVE
jgi:hypothetical protein